MTRQKILAQAAKIREIVKVWYAKEGPKMVRERLRKVGIRVSVSTISHTAGELGIKYQDPGAKAKIIREAVKKYYERFGARGVLEHVKNAHGVETTQEYIKSLASNLRISYERGNAQEEPLEGELRELIVHGALLDGDNAIAKLHEKLRKEADVASIKPNFLQNREDFTEKVSGIVWDSETLKAFEKVMRRGMPIETFLKYYSYIPQRFAAAKVRELRGISNLKHPAEFMRGIGRVTDVSKIDPRDIVRFEKNSIKHPYISGVTKSHWTGRVINGANIGIKHTPIIEENPVRCALANAQRRKEDFVVLVSLIDLDLKKAGGTPQIYRSQISGYNTNVDILSESYQPRAKAVLAGDEEGLIYETVAEKFLNILSGWRKNDMRPDGKPEFQGPVFIILGPKEDDFIKTATYWELRYKTLLRQKDLAVELSLANKELKKALESGAAKKKIEELTENRNMIAEELSRTRVSNHRREDMEDYARRIRTFVVQKIEEAIPNSKVIGQGSTYMKIGDEMVLFEIPPHTRVTDELLADFSDHYGPRVLRGEIPRTVVRCHPHSLNFRRTTREVDVRGKRGSARVYVAPILIDEKFLRSQLLETTKRVHPLEKAIWAGQFQAGVIDLACIDGVVHAEPFTVGALIKSEVGHGIYSKTKDAPSDKYIWAMLPSDPHWGWGWKEFVHPENGRDLGMCEAVIEMMRRAKLFEKGKMPLHIFAIADDPTQGNHFETQKQPHQHKIPFHKIEGRWLAALKEAERGDAAKRLEVLREMRRFNLYQFQVRGEHWTQDQVDQAIERLLEPNIDFFDALLTRTVDAGIVLRGVSAFNDNDHFPAGTPDTRDIGAVNFSTGNHFLNTVEWAILEGPIYAKNLRLMLRARPQWNGKEELLDELVKAPVYGNITVGWGTVKAPGGYEWGLEVRNKPTKLSSWGDTLLAAVRNDERRGNYSRIFDRRMTLKVYGDKHFDGAVLTGHTVYVMAMPGVPTEVYGELGFPPNNTGVSFVGLPVSGPDGGPILIRTLPFDFLRDYWKKPFDFDWAEFLPNPV